jgi:dTMP kinase
MTPAGRWICIDGTEGAGKTTLARGLSEGLDVTPIAEFSATPFGSALRDAVRTSPHFISASPIGQSLVFIGDFIELFESQIAPALEQGETVLTDRGWLTKLAYQQVVLERAMAPGPARSLASSLIELIPSPDLSILLCAPSDVVRQRLLNRDGNCDSERLAFIERASEVCLEIADQDDPPIACTVVDSDQARNTVLAQALRIIDGRSQASGY